MTSRRQIRGMQRLLSAHPDVEILGSAEGVASATHLYKAEHPDVVFLDVTLTDGEGFELFRKLTPMPLVVLVTASASHAIRAFEVGAIDFLLKPVAPDRLETTMDRLRNAMDGSGERAITDRSRVEGERFIVSSGSNTLVLSVDEICLLQADADYTRILLTNGRDHLISKRLGQIEVDLAGTLFARLGRSLIVNLAHVDRVETRTNGGSALHMNGLKRPIALGRSATQRLRKVLAAS